MRPRADVWLAAAAVLLLATGTSAAHPAAPYSISETPEQSEPSDAVPAPVNERDRLALIFIGYTSAKLCADAGHGFSATEITRIADGVTRASDQSSFSRAEQDALWIDVLTSMSRSKDAPSAENCAEDRQMLRYQIPEAFAPPKGEQSGL